MVSPMRSATIARTAAFPCLHRKGIGQWVHSVLLSRMGIRQPWRLQEYPALPPTSKADISKIKAYAFPVAEINGTIWIYIPEKLTPNPEVKEPLLIFTGQRSETAPCGVYCDANQHRSFRYRID